MPGLWLISAGRGGLGAWWVGGRIDKQMTSGLAAGLRLVCSTFHELIKETSI